MTDTKNSNVNNINVNLSGYGQQQMPWIVRAIYFLSIGWWLAGAWVSVAYFFALTIIGLPIANNMFNSTAKVLTLQR